jgi:glycosyl transferase family 87
LRRNIADESETWLNLAKPSSFFTRKRVRGHATLLAVVVWTLYAANLTHPGLHDWFGQVKGADFVHEYVLGKIALERNEPLLYDYQGQLQLSRQVIPGLEGESYLPIYGPQVSLLYAPFAMLPYLWATALWMFFSAAIYAACCYAVWRTTPNLRGEGSTIAILSLALPAFFNLIAFGQNSTIALGAFVLAYLGLRGRKPFFAGMALGLLVYKPQLGIAAAILFVLTLEWRLILGGLVTAASQLGIARVYYGKICLLDYVHALRNLGQNARLLEPKLFQMYSLRSFWQMLLPWPRVAFALYLISALIVLVLLYRTWRSPGPLSLQYAAFLVATVLVDPHLTSYDLIVLAPAFLLIGDWILGNSAAEGSEKTKWLLYLSYALPLFGPAIRGLHVQAAVPAFFLLLTALLAHSSQRMSLRSSGADDGFTVPG